MKQARGKSASREIFNTATWFPRGSLSMLLVSCVFIVLGDVSGGIILLLMDVAYILFYAFMNIVIKGRD
jgi:hypothetical protein